ncbi:type II toxin-antitoxin system CcdA family antitoxin [Shimia sp. R9_2]|uniref:type II toxin-antitoxin system CcdA family antitoxin n=1 Tax=Shimia sp. R9_2 TaxID=2821112 RepID=UPI001ADD3921|nr:type II toxin-antitoxin system CcdA family antitoxin [Shimia sp. R9_2]MBO9398532.1 type II toxin-antitoxin system CcdA family antitoxin [Shimia sp. R9_2]
MSRIKVNLTLEAEVVAKARDLGLNMSRLAEAAIVEACKAEQNRRWREENRAAIEAYGQEVASGAVRPSETVPTRGPKQGPKRG